MSRPGESLEAALIEQAKKDYIQELVPDDVPVRADGEKPQFIILAGQQAAGKTTTQERVAEALGGRLVATYDGDDLAEIHPRYSEIMRNNGLQGQSAVEQKLPGGLYEEVIGHLRGDMGGPKYDVVASHPFEQKKHADLWLDGFRSRGYETTVVFIAAHESTSLLGIAHRYQKGRDDPTRGYGRWVGPSLHDTAYLNNPRIAHYLESSGKVDHIYVANRSGEVLYENHRNPDGSMQNDPGAREAIIEERNRTPTPQEIAHFDSIVAYMRSTDPAVRTEPVDDMVKMAVDYAEQDHKNLRRKGNALAAPTAPTSRRTIGEALREQLRDAAVAPEPVKISGTSRAARIARGGQVSSGTSRAARIAQRGIAPSGTRSQDAGSTPSPSSAGDRGIEF